MRSSETRARNVLADGGRRGSKSLKLRISKPQSPSSVDHTPSYVSPLYSEQLWQASGQRQQRLSCERGLYFPELSAGAPAAKQLPDDSIVDVQQGKRAKLVGGQHRRASFRAAAASDNSPPGTPYRRSRTAGEEKAGNIFASSSSSQDLNELQQRRELLPSTFENDLAWPLVVTSKRRRGMRLRRTDWTRWQMLLHGMDGGHAAVCPADMGNNHESADMEASPLLQLQQQQQQLLAHNEQQLQQLLCDKQQRAAGEGHPPKAQQVHAQQQQDCGGEAAVLQMQPPAPKLANMDASVSITLTASKQASKQATSDVSPGHETSQSSELTYMQESPSAIAAPLESWPSSSTDSDCQGQPPVLDAGQTPGLVVQGASGVVMKLLAADHQLPGQTHSPSSTSSPFNVVV